MKLPHNWHFSEIEKELENGFKNQISKIDPKKVLLYKYIRIVVYLLCGLSFFCSIFATFIPEFRKYCLYIIGPSIIMAYVINSWMIIYTKKWRALVMNELTNYCHILSNSNKFKKFNITIFYPINIYRKRKECCCCNIIDNHDQYYISEIWCFIRFHFKEIRYTKKYEIIYDYYPKNNFIKLNPNQNSPNIKNIKLTQNNNNNNNNNNKNNKKNIKKTKYKKIKNKNISIEQELIKNNHIPFSKLEIDE